MKTIIVKHSSLVLLFLGVSGAALGAVPEIDAGTAGSGLAFLAGAVLLIRGTRRK